MRAETQLSPLSKQRILCNPFLKIVSCCKRIDLAEYMYNQDLCYIEQRFKTEVANSKRKLLLQSYLEFSCEEGLVDFTTFLMQEISRRQEYFQSFTFDGVLLQIACKHKHIEVFKYLLEDEKAKEEAAEFLKDSPLHNVCENGSWEMVQHLIERYNLDFETKDKKGKTPLYCALKCGSIQIARYLVEQKHACIDGRFEDGRNLFHAACKSRSLELIKYISDALQLLDVNTPDENGMTALHLACEWRNLKVVKFLSLGVSTSRPIQIEIENVLSGRDQFLKLSRFSPPSRLILFWRRDRESRSRP